MRVYEAVSQAVHPDSTTAYHSQTVGMDWLMCTPGPGWRYLSLSLIPRCCRSLGKLKIVVCSTVWVSLAASCVVRPSTVDSACPKNNTLRVQQLVHVSSGSRDSLTKRTATSWINTARYSNYLLRVVPATVYAIEPEPAGLRDGFEGFQFSPRLVRCASSSSSPTLPSAFPFSTTSPSVLRMVSTSFSRLLTLCSALASLSVGCAAPHARRAYIPSRPKFVIHSDAAVNNPTSRE
ncbi:hypothetical protein PYCCODRAFT_1309294 [Trametes coccinea BRFM310]|uniref:Uncharacterized protein n=1 Tax=Trametes coccinea (strain BRFM310) TaxID=1353009 RepID=A0A1Y2I5J3_TRAC3|nr:hypothetical protein PYCCODRAFT_1309294 [Trametes coccinea BRFM310]